MTDGTAVVGASADREFPLKELKGTGYELFVLLVSLLSFANTAIVLLPFGGPIKQVALLVDTMLAVVFLLDFLYRFRTAPSRRRYFVRQFGWADMLSAVPALGVFRIFRVVRTLRAFRAYGGREMATDLDRTRASSTFMLTLFLVIVVVEFAGMAVLLVESPDPAANIVNAGDAVWWGFVTITTVGYGDEYPVTGPGRVIGTALLFAGIALFSVLTGFIANLFLAPREPERRLFKPVRRGLDAEVDQLRALLIEQERAATRIRRKLEDVERALSERERAERTRAD
jgi:voltage-gated potassium channel